MRTGNKREATSSGRKIRQRPSSLGRSNLFPVKNPRENYQIKKIGHIQARRASMKRYGMPWMGTQASNITLGLSSSRGNRGSQRRATKRPIPIIVLLSVIGVLITIYFGLLFTTFFHHQRLQQQEQGEKISESERKSEFSQERQTRNFKQSDNLNPTQANLVAAHRPTYQDWRDFAIEMSALSPGEVLHILKEQDPFGVRSFEKALLQRESDEQAILQMDDIKKLFPCPSERITLPDQRNHENAKKYREGIQSITTDKENFVFLFFQHLRKAGGTNFCGLAEKNLLKRFVPK